MRRVPVVVTGVGVICPIGRDTDEFWANLVAGNAGVTLQTSGAFGHLDRAFAGAVPDGWLPGGDEVERNTRLALVAAREAMVASGLVGPGASAGRAWDERAALVLGKCQGTPGPRPDAHLPFHEPADNVARAFGLGGPRVVISTACAAGGNAVGTGRDLLWDGNVDVVLAGGVDTLQPESQAGFASLMALSDGPTAPYSASSGLSLGEGAAFLVLETLAHAEARGATVLAEVAGYGLSADAYHATAPDPTARGPISAVRRALDGSGLTLDDVSYVNGHGTGTPANDRMERKAMRSLFGQRAATVPISSTKAAIGHSLGASGAIEAVACVCAIRESTVPPTVNFIGPPPGDMDFVPNLGRPARVDVTLSNNYAFGGNNCSLVLARQGRGAGGGQVTGSDRVVISGVGVVGGFGIGVDAWRAAFASGRTAIAPLTTMDGKRFGCGTGVEPYPLGRRPLAAPGLWRHMNDFARYALAATTGACDDAGLGTRAGREDVGLVFATGYGPVRTAVELSQAMRTEGGPSAVSFSNATVNAAAGAVCQALTLRGPTTTIASGGVSAIGGLDNAVALIRTGQAQRIVLVATDEICEPVMAEFGRRNLLASDGVMRPYDAGRTGTVLGTCAVALVIESADALAARGGRAYCEVAGVAHLGARGGADSVPETVAAVARRAVAAAGVDGAGVRYCAGAGAGVDHDLMELDGLSQVLAPDLLLSAPKSLTGECGAGSGGVSLLAAALAVAEGLVPATANVVTPAPVFAHVTVPITGATVPAALANASTPLSAYGSAVLTSVPPASVPHTSVP